MSRIEQLGRILSAAVLALVLLLLVFTPLVLVPFRAMAQPAAPSVIRVGYLTQARHVVLPNSFLEVPPADEGVQGARLGVADDDTTGRFTHQNFALDEAIVPEDGDVAGAFRHLAASGDRFVIVDLPAAEMTAVAALPEAADVTLFNSGAPDDELRAAGCRKNVLHVLPSRGMLADALVQYLVVKRWTNLLLVVGATDGDKAYAAAIRNSAQKFRAKIVAEKPWTFKPGAKRTDTGHYEIEQEVARFTQGIDYDVLVVADEDDEFGDDLNYHTYAPRPVAGTQGMVPTAWARPFEQWGATQLQSRFQRQAHRWMTPRDYTAWVAARAVGEAATRSKSADPPAIAAFLRSPQFELGIYKGAPASFRSWDGQLRQAILIAAPRSLVSVSPQPGFLHQVSVLDTLGIDQPESKCHMQ